MLLIFLFPYTISIPSINHHTNLCHLRHLECYHSKASMKSLYFLFTNLLMCQFSFALSTYLSTTPSSTLAFPRRNLERIAFGSPPYRAAFHDSVLQNSQFYSPKLRASNGESNNNHNVVDLKYSEFPPPFSTPVHHPVILLHGLLGNKRNFSSLAASLSTQLSIPRPIYTVDLRNHGENTHDWRNTMSYSEMARDVLNFMDQIAEKNDGADQYSKAIIVGHSMGGKVAQSLALMYPNRVAGLVILDIAPVKYSSDEKGGTWKTVEEIVRSVAELDLEKMGCQTKKDVDAVLRQKCMLLEDPALRAFVLTNLDQHRPRKGEENAKESALKWKIHWKGIVNQLDRIAGFDVHDQPMDDIPMLPSNGVNSTLKVEESSSFVKKTIPTYKYEGDVFFIHGGASRFVRHSHISTIATFFPNHMLTTIRGAGHWVHAEAPDDTVALLKKYLDR